MRQRQMDVDHVFTYHAPTHEQWAKYEAVRQAARNFAVVILNDVPAGADQSAALRKVREAAMTANAAIALGGRLEVQDPTVTLGTE